MTSNPLSDGTKQTVETVRKLIENKTAIMEEKGGMVWKYAGQELLNALTTLKRQMNDEGNKVVECNAYNVAKGANIKNPTGRLFLIPVTGRPTLTSDDPLSLGSCYFLEDELSLFGQGIAIIIVVLEKQE